eukprot:11211168-Lingulodinium_polyedra.AAC.1
MQHHRAERGEEPQNLPTRWRCILRGYGDGHECEHRADWDVRRRASRAATSDERRRRPAPPAPGRGGVFGCSSAWP